jgi:hypothetical protein
MYAEKNEKKMMYGGVRAAVCAILLLAALAKGQNLLAVLDLERDSSVSQKEVTAVCDRISAVISNDSSYMQFERSQLPELLKQLYIEESATGCSDPQCLTVIGSLIGANFIVGGSIRKKGSETAIELNLVDVAKKQAINTGTREKPEDSGKTYYPKNRFIIREKRFFCQFAGVFWNRPGSRRGRGGLLLF